MQFTLIVYYSQPNLSIKYKIKLLPSFKLELTYNFPYLLVAFCHSLEQLKYFCVETSHFYFKWLIRHHQTIFQHIMSCFLQFFGCRKQQNRDPCFLFTHFPSHFQQTLRLFVSLISLCEKTISTICDVSIAHWT